MIYELSYQALAVVEEIIRYTDAHFGGVQTGKYIDGLYFSFELLLDNSQMGCLFDGEVRRYLYKGHYVYYEIKNNSITILQISSTRMNPHLQ